MVQQLLRLAGVRRENPLSTTIHRDIKVCLLFWHRVWEAAAGDTRRAIQHDAHSSNTKHEYNLSY